MKIGKAVKMTKLQRKKIESIYWSACEAADILGVCMNTMYALLKKGTVNGCRIGSTWRIRKSDLVRPND
jgi:excisionase family DNA binding protein